MRSFVTTGFLQVGHLPWAAMAALMHALQKIWPHFVVVPSTSGPRQIGQLKVGPFGAGRGDFAEIICKT